MTPKKPDPHLLTVWRLRLFLAALVPSFLSAFYYSPRHMVWQVFTGGWAGVFLLCYLWLLPLRLRRLAYSWEGGRLQLWHGIFYRHLRAIPLASVQTVCLASTPLERLYGLRRLQVTAAGASLVVPGLPLAQAAALQRELTPAPKGGSPLA